MSSALVPLHKKWIFLIKISSVNVTFRIWSHLLKKSFNGRVHFLWSVHFHILILLSSENLLKIPLSLDTFRWAITVSYARHQLVGSLILGIYLLQPTGCMMHCSYINYRYVTEILVSLYYKIIHNKNYIVILNRLSN